MQSRYLDPFGICEGLHEVVAVEQAHDKVRHRARLQKGSGSHVCEGKKRKRAEQEGMEKRKEGESRRQPSWSISFTFFGTSKIDSRYLPFTFWHKRACRDQELIACAAANKSMRCHSPTLSDRPDCVGRTL